MSLFVHNNDNTHHGNITISFVCKELIIQKPKTCNCQHSQFFTTRTKDRAHFFQPIKVGKKNINTSTSYLCIEKKNYFR